jgi:predicted membrane protein
MEKMENVANREQRNPHHNNRWGGIVLIIIGILFLLHRLPQTSSYFPSWFFTWPMLLVGIGIFTGIKSGFRNIAWLILLLIGGYALLYENNLVALNLKPYAFPLGLIIVGIIVMVKRGNNRRCRQRYNKHWGPQSTGPIDAKEDFVNISSTFGSVERNIFSKDFKGGTISSVFGGAQVNFIQADFQGTAVVDVSIIFGGADIVIPSNWNLKNEISVVFGGIEDRRTVAPNVSDSGKTLILRGNIMFGGIEIKSY